MAYAARDREDVPDRVKIPDLFYSVENHADRVEHSAAYKEPKAPRVHHLQKRMNSENYHPAHCDVADYGRLAEFFEVNGIEHDSDHRRAPDNAEQNPADSAAKDRNRYRRICARDKEKYRVVIHDPEKSLCRGVCDRMVQRAHAVEYYQARAEYRAADHRPGVAVYRGENDEHNRSRNREQTAYAVSNRAENLLAERVSFRSL